MAPSKNNAINSSNWSINHPLKSLSNLFHRNGESKKSATLPNRKLKGSENSALHGSNPHLKGSSPDLSLEVAVNKLNEIAPLTLKEPWDNVGLLVEPPTARPIKIILLTNDLTVPVLEEAVNGSVDMIVAYHPPIFKSINRLTTDSWKNPIYFDFLKEKVVGVCVEKGIAVYSPHTCWDVMNGGTADWLASAFSPAKVEPLIAPRSPAEEGKKVRFLVEVHGAKNLGNGEHAKKNLESEESKITYSNPKEKRFIITTTSELLPHTLKKISTTFAGSSSTIKLEGARRDDEFGVGRFVTLEKAQPIKDLVEKVKRHLDVPHLQLALSFNHSPDQLVKKIALVPGSGASVLLNSADAEVFLTGEMSHHEVLDANHHNVSVILAQHSNTERGFLKLMAERLSADFADWNTKVVVSKNDRDPLVIV